MREDFSLPATVEALQLLIPCPIYDELVVKGDDCPSWRVSLVEFKIWPNKRVILKWLIPICNKAKEKKNDKTARGTTLTGFFGRLEIHLPSKFYLSSFTTQI